jgi:hypothetical protein
LLADVLKAKVELLAAGLKAKVMLLGSRLRSGFEACR